MSETTRFTKQIAAGQFRTQLKARGRVDKVALIGLRNRPMVLTNISNEEMNSRLSRTPTNEIRQEFVMRGTPSVWSQIGTVIYIWPIPIHEWKLEGEMV